MKIPKASIWIIALDLGTYISTVTNNVFETDYRGLKSIPYFDLECNHVLAECHFPQYRGRHQLGIPGH
jgi:hypothetical protein